MTDDLRTDVFNKKYSNKGESIQDMHLRMAKEFARTRYKKDKTRSEEEWTSYFVRKLSEFNNIVPQGSVMAVLGTDIVGSLSNCFVIGQPYDSYSGILHKDEELVSLMKRRGGVGLDISTLRPAQTKVNNVALTSTGAVSFMERFSNSTREVAQGGRRGALMLTIDVRHPDVLEFINAKKDRTKVTGANISVLLRDDFMEAVEKDEDYILRFPCSDNENPLLMVSKGEEEVSWVYSEGFDGELPYNKLIDCGNGRSIKKIKAKEIYDAIVENAWENAEPGQMFVDRHWNYSPDSVYEEYKGVTTNPCGEIFMQQYDACRLILINLASYVHDATFNEEAFIADCYEMQLMADDLVDLELEYIDRIINKIVNDPEPNEIKKRELSLWTKIRYVAESSRRTGCGITGLGDALALMYTDYTNTEAIEKIMRLKFQSELLASIDLAKKHGPFKGWDKDKEFDLIDGKLVGKNAFFAMIAKEFPILAEDMYKHGRRNVSWSTVAPAGSVSIMTETTSGLEPLFAPWHLRRRKINPNETSKIDFVDQNGDSWQEYPVIHKPLETWIKSHYSDFNMEEESFLQEAFENSPWFKNTANDINWLDRVKVQEVIQKYTSHSISSTINLPEDIEKETVYNIYLESWRKGLKGQTIYRDGSRTGVLLHKKEEFKEHDAPKRPKVLEGEVHIVTVKGTKYNVIIGLLEDKVYEVFAHFNEGTLAKQGPTKIIKLKSGEYQYESNGNDIAVTSDMSDEEEAITRLASTSLRHGANIKFVAEQLNKTKGDLTNFSKAMARVLKKYIADGEKSTLKCLDCGSKEIIFEEGCEKCTSCGSAKCG